MSYFRMCWSASSRSSIPLLIASWTKFANTALRWRTRPPPLPLLLPPAQPISSAVRTKQRNFWDRTCSPSWTSTAGPCSKTRASSCTSSNLPRQQVPIYAYPVVSMWSVHCSMIRKIIILHRRAAVVRMNQWAAVISSQMLRIWES